MLVRVVAGGVFDVAVDVRPSSFTFSKSICILLSAENKRQLWIPPGFAHGFYVVSEWAETLSTATDSYDPKAEKVINWNDPTLNVPWSIAPGKMPTLSPKDLAGDLLPEAEIYE